jgi:FMN phosphatase YigB (HAD superfamily)
MPASLSAVFFDLGDTLVDGHSTTTWLPGAKAALSALKSKGFRLGIISNTATLSRSQILGILPADFDIKLFESQLVLFSSEVGVEKPKPQIFNLAVTRSNASASSCLFVTEDIVDTLVAQHVGLRSIRVTTGSEDLTNLPATISKYMQAAS